MDLTRVSRFVILLLAAAGLVWALFGARLAAAAETPLRPAPSWEGRLARQAERFASKREAPVDPALLARAITTITPSREWAAFLLTVAVHESALAERLRVNDCRAHECDHGRAWGLWQNWRTEGNGDAWGSPDLTVQAKTAAHLSKQMFNMCKRSGVPFPLGVFRALGGRGCHQPLRGEQARVATYQRILKGL